MGRLSDYFDSHRDNVEEGVKKVLGKADDTLEVLRKRLEEVEAKLREVAGEAPQQTDKDLNAQNAGVVTSEQAGTSTESVAAQADKSARQTRTKK